MIKRFRWAKALCGLLIVCVGCQQSDVQQVQSPSSGQAVPAAVAVQTVAVESTPIERTTVQPATVLPYYEAEIRANVTGYVEELSVDIGDFVQAGDVLVQLDVPDLEAQRPVLEARINRALAEETRAGSQVALAESQVRSAQALFEQSQAEQSQAQAALAAAQAEYARTDDLVGRGSLQSRMLDETRLRRDSQQARISAVESAIASAEADVDVARAQLAAAQADQQAAMADTEIARRQLDELQTQLDFATLTAPFAGTITQRNISPGDLAKSHSADMPLLMISQMDKVRVHIPVPETDAPLIQQGAKVTLTFPSFPAEEAISASVTRFTGSLAPSTRSMMVEVELENPQHKLIPGMFGQATIELSQNVAVNSLPARALRFDESGKAYVYVVDQSEKINVIPVTTGIDNGLTIEIVSGVQPGMQVVDAHLQRFTAGQSVRVLTE